MDTVDLLRGCPKCGTNHHNVRVEHRLLGTSKGGEVMKRTCGKCGAVWYEKPLDARV